MVKEKKYKSPVIIIAIIILSLYVLLFLLLILWAVMTSFKDIYEFDDSSIAFPSIWIITNYINVIRNFNIQVVSLTGISYIAMPEMYLNSIIYSVGSAFFSVVAITLIGYAIAFFPCKISNILYSIILIVMMIPIVGTESSMVIFLRRIGLYDTWLAPFAMKFGFTNMYTLVVINTIKALPRDITESAQLDGASQLNIMLRINIPMVKNILFTVFLLNFVIFWNDYQMPLLYIPSMPTVSYGVWYFNTNSASAISNVPSKLAAAVLLLVPVFTVFLIFQKRIMGADMTMGAVKE